MKILMLGWELPPYHTGGLGVACYQMCQQMAVDGFDIEFILPFDAPHNINFMTVTSAINQSPEAVLYEAGPYSITSSKQQDLRPHVISTVLHQQEKYHDGVTKLVPYREFDVIHAHDWLTFRAAMQAKTMTGKPLIAHVHATEYDRSGGGSGNPVIRDIEYAGLCMADQIVAVSQATKNTLIREYSIPEQKITVAHNALSVDALYSSEQVSNYAYIEHMKRQGYKVVLSAGRLTIQKGLTFLLAAAQKVIERNDKVLFLIVGGGEQYHELIEECARLGIAQNVLFSGYLNGTGQEWRDAFRVADLFVMPSVSEPFGITPLEAINYGSPALISKQSGVSEILNNALKVDFWDTNEMANKILAVVEHQSLHDVLLQGAQEEYKNITWSNTTKTIAKIYNKQVRGVAA